MKTPTVKSKAEGILSEPRVWKKKGLVTPVKFDGRSKASSLWLRLGIPILPKENRTLFLENVSSAIKAGMKRGKEIIVGFNSVSRIIEKSPFEVSVVCITKEKGTMKVLDALVEAAVNRKIPIILLQNLSDVLCNVLELKSLSCFCLRKKVIGTSISAPIAVKNTTGDNADINETCDPDDDIHLSARMDALQDLILSYSMHEMRNTVIQ